MPFRLGSISARIVLLLSANLVACGDNGVQPRREILPAAGSLSASRAGSTGSDASGKVKLSIAKRSVPLARDETVCALVTAAGRQVTLARAGLTVTFNKGSVATDSYVCLVAKHGDELAYSFYPHGLRFKVPITVEQQVRGTAGEFDAIVATSMVFAYTDNDADLDETTGTGHFSQLFSTRLEQSAGSSPGVAGRGAGGLSATFTTDHFSVYAVTTGKGGSAE